MPPFANDIIIHIKKKKGIPGNILEILGIYHVDN